MMHRGDATGLHKLSATKQQVINETSEELCHNALPRANLLLSAKMWLF